MAGACYYNALVVAAPKSLCPQFAEQKSVNICRLGMPRCVTRPDRICNAPHIAVNEFLCFVLERPIKVDGARFIIGSATSLFDFKCSEYFQVGEMQHIQASISMLILIFDGSAK